MSELALVVKRMREDAGLSQRAFAEKAGTSQPAIVRYERGAASPSWETLQRLAAACGRQLDIKVEPRPDPHDVELAKSLLDVEPLERLRALRRFNRLRTLVEERA